MNASVPFQGVLVRVPSSYLGPKHTMKNLPRVRWEQAFRWLHHTCECEAMDDNQFNQNMASNREVSTNRNASIKVWRYSAEL